MKDIVSAVRAFQARFAGTRIEGLPDVDGPTIGERLTRLDQLRTDGVITAEEHAQQRERILREL